MSQESRSIGALVGLGVGNILGMQFKGMPGTEVRRIIPGKNLPVPLRELALPWDDDLAMAMELAEHLVENGGDIGPTKLLERYKRWSIENGRGIGMLTREVLELAQTESIVSPAERAWRLRGGSAGGSAAGNGAIMRVAPVGIRFRRDPVRVVRNAIEDARLTHWDPLCQWTSAATAILIADMIMDRVTPLEETLPSLGCPAPLTKQILEEPPIDIESAQFDGPDMGYTLHAWKIALWVSHTPGSFERLLARIIRCGGDTDTNGAIAGAILGARFGNETIPASWLDPMHDRRRIEQAAAA